MILIDTHVWIWLNSVPDKLSLTAKDLLVNCTSLAMSSLSIYETMTAIEKGRVSSPFDPETMVRRWLKSKDIARIPVSDEIAILSRSLNFELGDPFDRLIAATAVHLNVPLMTADRNLLRLPWLANIPAQ